MIGITSIFLLSFITVTIFANSGNLSSDKVETDNENISYLNLDVKKIEGNNMVSLRQLAQRYHWILLFSNKDKAINIYNFKSKVQIKIKQVQFNGNQLKNPPVIKNGRTYISLDLINYILQDFNNSQIKLITDMTLNQNQKKVEKGEKITAKLKVYNIYQKPVTLKYNSGRLYDL